MDADWILQAAVQGVTGATVVGGAGAWLLREKVDKYVNDRVVKKMSRTNERLDAVEERMAKQETQGLLFAQAMGTVAEKFEEGMTRLTRTFERFEERQDETAKAVARIEGAMERRSNPRD